MFLLSAVLCTTTHAQVAEWADQRSEEIQYQRILPIGGDRWAILGKVVFGGAHLISVRNADGSIAWENIDPYFTRDEGDVQLTADSGLVHVGVQDGCDVSGPQSRVRRYSANETILWERTIEPLFTGFVTIAAKGSADRLAVASQDSVYVLDQNGDLTGGFPAPGSHIRKAHWKGDTALYLFDGPSIRLVDLNGAELATHPIPALSWDMHFDGQQLFVLSPDTVRRFSADLVPLGDTPLPTLNTTGEFVVSGNGLFVRTADGLYSVPDGGPISLLFPWPPLPAMNVTGCAVRNDKVFQVGNTDISTRSTGMLRSLTLAGEAAQHDEDVEVLLQVDSAWAQNAGFWKRQADVTGRVVNHGSDTLRSVVLSMWIDLPALFCALYVNRIDTAGFALAPGNTMDLPFGVVDVGYYYMSDQAVGEGQICIVALAPDHLADRHPEDNTACVTTDFVLGLHGTRRTPSISLAPDPASTTCTITGLGALGAKLHLYILDPTGRSVFDLMISDARDQYTVDLAQLPTGQYQFVAEGARGRAVAPLIVARP